LGKETGKPFPKAFTKRTCKPGEIIYGDLSGKMPISSLGGANYLLLLKDECTGFRHVNFIKHKSETADCVKVFLKLIKNQTIRNVKIFKSDNGTEFACQELQLYLVEEGIIHENTSPYCPESNGKIEREMRTIKDTARSMMKRSSAPENL